VGTVQVGVQSVSPFEDYISSLEPQFDLKPQDAFDRAIAQTQVEDSALVNQFLATLQVALPQITHTKTASSANDGTKTTDTSTDAHSEMPLGELREGTPSDVSYRIAGGLGIDPGERQRLLETENAGARLGSVLRLLERENNRASSHGGGRFRRRPALPRSDGTGSGSLAPQSLRSRCRRSYRHEALHREAPPYGYAGRS